MQSILKNLRKSFNSNRTRSLEWRLEQLAAIERLIDENAAELIEALKLDLNKPEHETITMEFGLIKNSVAYISRNLALWMQPKKESPVMQVRALYSTYTCYQPLGVTLIIGAWNYPVTLIKFYKK